MTNRQAIRMLLSSLFLCFSLHASTQTDSTMRGAPDTAVLAISSPDSLYRFNGRYLKSYWLDFREVVTGPTRWTGRDWKRLGIITGTGTLLLVFADSEVRNWTMNNQKEALQSATTIVEPFGNRLPP